MRSFLSFYKHYLNLSKKIKSRNNCDFIGMFGKTYEDNLITSTKLYFDLNDYLDVDFFSKNNEKKVFKKYSPFIDFTRTFSNCIALKKNACNKINKYFHFKFVENFSYESIDCIFNINLEKFKKGMSFENNETKRYYYIDEQAFIKTILEKLKININTNELKYIEFTVNPLKGIFIFKNNDTKKILNGITENCPGYVINDVMSIYNNYNVYPCLFGKYYNASKFTVYWDLNHNNFNYSTKFFKYIIGT